MEDVIHLDSFCLQCRKSLDNDISGILCFLCNECVFCNDCKMGLEELMWDITTPICCPKCSNSHKSRQPRAPVMNPTLTQEKNGLNWVSNTSSDGLSSLTLSCIAFPSKQIPISVTLEGPSLISLQKILIKSKKNNTNGMVYLQDSHLPLLDTLGISEIEFRVYLSPDENRCMVEQFALEFIRNYMSAIDKYKQVTEKELEDKQLNLEITLDPLFYHGNSFINIFVPLMDLLHQKDKRPTWWAFISHYDKKVKYFCPACTQYEVKPTNHPLKCKSCHDPVLCRNCVAKQKSPVPEYCILCRGLKSNPPSLITIED